MFTTFKIGARLGVAFGTLILLLLVVCGFGTWSAHQLSDDLSATARTDLVAVQAASGLQQRAGVIAAASRELLIVDSAGQIKRQRGVVDTALADSDALFGQLEVLHAFEDQRALLANIREAREAYAKGVAKFLTVHEAGNPDDTRAALLIDLRPRQEAYQKALGELATALKQRVDARADAAARTSTRTVQALLALGLAGSALAMLAAWTISRSVTGRLQQAVRAAEDIKAGDLAHSIDSNARDEIGDVLRAIGGMQRHLQGTIENVMRSARDVATSSDELAHGNAELSSRTERSAGSLQQTASAVEQISATVSGSSAKSREASEVADRARKAVVEGGAAMDKLVETMTRIAASSARIKDITAVIDGIAFQTNILALNAAVEAARAGEQGRGFAVVAAEVRSLAARASGAAREIKGLIDDAAERVSDGTATVADVGERIKGIVDQVHEVGTLIAELSHASQEQASGMASVNGSVIELDQSTQQNAALVEEIAATADSLKGHARRLVETVEFFRLPAAAA